MRFVWAVTAFVLAALMIGAGIAQRTVLQGPRTESQTISVSGNAPYVLIDGSVLNSHTGSQTLRVKESGTIFASYGRTADLEAWLTPSSYTHVTLDGDELATTAVAAKTPPAEGSAAITPVGSDLWLDEFQQDDLLVTPLQLPADMSLLVATDGIKPAPQSMTVTWPTGATTPWAGPLIVGGSILLLIGLVLYVLGVRHARRSRGPRRKGLPMPVTEPIDVAVEGADKGVISATPTRRQLSRGKRVLLAAPAVGLSALLFTGCTADAWPQLAGTPTPTASESVVVPQDQGSPAVTQAHAERILTRISEQVAKADAAKDPAAAAERLTDSALAARETDYRLRDVAGHTALGALPDKPVKVILPEAYDGWPRTFFAVIETGDVILSVTQEDPWSPYKVTNQAELVSQASLNLAPAYVGAIAIDPDSPFLALAPNKVAAAYADILTNGDSSPFAGQFDATNDPFRKLVADNRAARLESFNQTGAQTGTLSFAASAGPDEPISLATLDSGAIVAVTVHESDTVKPTNTDAVIKLDNNPIVQTLTGVNQSSSGFTTTFVDQLFFFVPSQSSNKRIQLLGYSTSILDAKVVS
ncbi:glycosyl transferase [Microbacterium hominis]|uniref:glycosyl transferase n=1 Tax=Microbacterium hominis TaxID=162426 RepID=UPI0019660DBC|nr:glycosyl transferase [Microbacterium hominis]QRY40984.1 glycosyl transferase [Microbacterium hominis]